MAFGAGVTLGGTADKTAGASIVHTVSAAAAVGDIVVVRVAKNNELANDANDTNEVTSVTDSAGNTYTKLGEARGGSAGAAAGAVGGIFISKLTTALTSGSSTITANFSNSPVASVLTAWKHTIGAGKTFQIAGTVQYEKLNASGPQALTISGLTSKEYLFLRAEAQETDTLTYAPTANYTEVSEVATSGGGQLSNMACAGEFRILTGTGDTSDPTGDSTDHVGILVALEEVAAGQTIAVGQTSEVDLAQAIAWAPKRRLLGQVSELNFAQAITALKTRVLAQASEVDLAQIITTGGGITIAVGQASEVDLAQPIAWAPKRRLLGQASELDLAQAIGKAKRLGIGQVAEVDLAQLIGVLKLRAVGQAAEVDLAQTIVWSPKRRLLIQVVEVDTASGLVALLIVPVVGYVETWDEALHDLRVLDQALHDVEVSDGRVSV